MKKAATGRSVELFGIGSVLQKLMFRFVFVLLMAFCVLPPAIAAGTYAGTAPVASQSDEDRAAALRAAFGQVIVKLGGSSAALSRPDVARAVSKADRYMQSYGYQADPALPAGHLQLVVQFDRAGIDALLHDLNMDAVPGAPAQTPAQAPAPAQTLATGDAATASPGNPTQNPASYRLWITGLRSAEDYARLIGGLNGNDQVRAVQVEQGRGTTVQVRIDARGALSSLLDALDVARLAHASNTHPPVAGVDALLDFEP
jgi:hypothetical protein